MSVPEEILRVTVHKMRDKVTVFYRSYKGEQNTTEENIIRIGNLHLDNPDIKWFMSHLRTSHTTTSLHILTFPATSTK